MATTQPDGIRIETREQLLYTLTEAAEIEHNLMCCYLYAAFSMKSGEAEGLTADQAKAVAGWKRAIIDVAVEEMGHLALVSNLMTAIGGAAHFGRPNFPITPGYHPAGIQVLLAPFDMETLQHFIFLERPEGISEPYGKGFEPPDTYRRTLSAEHRLMPSGQDYETVGELYTAIEYGLTRIAERDGETALFVGDPEGQVGPDVVSLPGLIKITTLNDALTALDTIVEQGEGAPQSHEDGHYQRFVNIRTAYQAILKDAPDFAPARHAARNPVMRKPVFAADRVWVNAPESAGVMDFANALYGQMLRLLSQAFGRPGPVDQKQVLLTAAIDLMFALVPAAEQLTRMPANEDDDCASGMSFAMLRPLAAFPQGPGEWKVLDQRFDDLVKTGNDLANLGPELAASAKSVAATAEAFRRGVTSLMATSPEQPKSAPETRGSNTVETVQGQDVTLTFDTARCIHARFCVTGAPRTFVANVEGEWLFPDQTAADQLAAIALACPSGAITVVRKDGGANEAAPQVNLLTLRENGPLAFRATLSINGHPDGFRATLCRCGQSKSKPYCDGSHVTAGFIATGEPETKSTDSITPRSGLLEVTPQINGPLAVSGPLEICSGTGRVVDRVTSARLCRCGGSKNKPYCDGTHVTIGFRSED